MLFSKPNSALNLAAVLVIAAFSALPVALANVEVRDRGHGDAQKAQWHQDCALMGGQTAKWDLWYDSSVKKVFAYCIDDEGQDISQDVADRLGW
ncbi:hypothetical protein IE81DRAFT_369411 [Ceraceosorus guamensis]|uniref:Uncharacterized protein n=1 Tax=Ceraceosorus guamensis TaxID=1522189 RepID=A0A316VN95_9BASI|nr:hypothetical protein IE81DRAFT_369411 [Ceraceosorus guamensis]PWN39036.1 hypothetical protein IE81DRAFT_369411 [Ceraceosorus guamensis]